MTPTLRATKRRKLDFKKAFQSRFDEVTHLSKISIIEERFEESADNERGEISFQKIREKFNNDDYAGEQEFLTDLSRLASRVKSSYINCLLFDAATELELFVERLVKEDQVDWVSSQSQKQSSTTFASRLSQFGLTETARSIKLDGNYSLQGDQLDNFDALSKTERGKLLLSWPLPRFDGGPPKQITAGIANADRTYEKTFDVGNSQYDVTYVSLAPLLPYNIVINDENELSLEQFTTKYVLPFLEAVNLDDFNPAVTSLAQQLEMVNTEEDVERLLDKSVYDVLRPILLKSLEDKIERIQKDMKLIIKSRPYLDLKGGSGDHFNLKSMMSQGKLQIPFLGTRTVPDLQLGFIEYQQRIVMLLSGMGEVKFVSLDLMSSLEELKRFSKLESERRAKLESERKVKRKSKHKVKHKAKLETVESESLAEDATFSSIEGDFKLTGTDTKKGSDEKLTGADPKKKSDEKPTLEGNAGVLSDIIAKYTSICAILGTSRFVISDFTAFLFVKIGVQEEENSQGFDVRPSTEKTYDEDREVQKQRFINAEFACFPSEEAGIRMKLMSFLFFNDSLLKEMETFRVEVSRLAGEISDEVADELKRQMNRPGTGDSGSTADDTNEPQTPTDAGKQRMVIGAEFGSEALESYSSSSTSKLVSATKGSGPETADANATITRSKLNEFNDRGSQVLKLDPEIFHYPALVRLGEKTIKQVVYLGNTSQVVLVDVQLFKKQVFKHNFIEHDYAEVLILKTFDPVIGQLVKYDEELQQHYISSYLYQDCINFTITEVQNYLRLEEYRGKFLPRLFSYGRLADIYPKVGEPYLRLTGGFLLIEQLEKDENFEMNRDAFEKVLKVFRLIHSKDVVHNDVNKDNIIFTKDGVKVIDFKKATYPANEEQKNAEIDLLYKCFGFRR